MAGRSAAGKQRADSGVRQPAWPGAAERSALEGEIPCRIVIRVGDENEVDLTELHLAQPLEPEVRPKIRARHDERPGFQQREGSNEAGPGSDRPDPFIGVHDGRPPARAVFQEVPDLPAPVAEVDDQLHEAGRHEPLDRVHDEWFSAHLEQRLRGRVRERPHALAASRGEDHGPQGFAPE